MPVYKTSSGRYKVKGTKGSGCKTKKEAEDQLKAIKINQKKRGK